MRLALIANPGSGKGTSPTEIAEHLRAEGADVVVCEGGWEGDAATRERIRGAERLVAAGGDGIVGACAALAGELGLPLAVIAVGTANDFARSQDLPRELPAACRLAASGTRTRRLELARMDGRPFVNAASAGLSPDAAAKADPLKPALGPVAYAAGALAAGLTGRRVDCTARVDGREVHRGPAWQVIVAASGAFGAGADIAEADPADGLLDVVVVPGGSRLALPQRAAGMRSGGLAAQPGVVHAVGDEVELDVDAGTRFNVDGELLECDDPTVRFSAERAAYELVVG